MSVCSFRTQHLSISRVNGSRLPGLMSPPTSLALEISPWGLTYSSMQVSKSEYHWESSVQHFWWETQGQICISMEFLKILAEGWVTQPCFRYPTKRHPPDTHFLCAYGCRICCDSTVCFYRAGGVISLGNLVWVSEGLIHGEKSFQNADEKQQNMSRYGQSSEDERWTSSSSIKDTQQGSWARIHSHSHTHSLVSQPLSLFLCNSFDQLLIYTLPLNDILQPVVQPELQLLCVSCGFICQDDICGCSWRVLCCGAGYLICVSVVDGTALPDTIAIILKWKWLLNYMGNLFSYKYMRQCTSVH